MKRLHEDQIITEHLNRHECTYYGIAVPTEKLPADVSGMNGYKSFEDFKNGVPAAVKSDRKLGYPCYKDRGPNITTGNFWLNYLNAATNSIHPVITLYNIIFIGACDDGKGNWKVTDADVNLVGGFTTDVGSPCYNEETEEMREGCYELLAPIPGFEGNEFFEEGTEVFIKDGRVGVIVKGNTDFSLGKYFNLIFKILIGLLGIAAVVMIAWAGFEYMTTEAFVQKSQAKERIKNVFIGLSLLLSIYIILNSINPNLLKIKPDIVPVSLSYESVGFDNQGRPILADENWTCPDVSALNLPSGASSYGDKFTYPVDPRAPINSQCGFRWGRPHAGVDMAAPDTTNVLAGAGGTVTMVVSGCAVGNQACGGGYGNLVVIKHGDVETRYAHLSSVSVSNGDEVQQGDVIGKVGTTGHSTGNHLHFEVLVGGKKINPQPWINI